MARLGLTEKEISVYIALLEGGPMAVQDIARNSDVNRVSTYAAIDELKRKGLLAESRKGKRKLMIAETPDALLTIIEQKKNELASEESSLTNDILPILKAINVSQPNKPIFKFFEGKDGITKVYDEYVLKTGEIINCGSYETATRAVNEKEEIGYFEEIKKRKIFYRSILEDTALNRRYGELCQGIGFTKFLPEGTKNSSDIVVAGRSLVVLVSYDKLAATLIEDESIAMTIKTYLDFMWERL